MAKSSKVIFFGLSALLVLVMYKSQEAEAEAHASHPCLRGQIIDEGPHPASSMGISDLNWKIRDEMRDPGSFNHIITQVSPPGSPVGNYDPGANGSIAVAVYEGRNGFGGVVREERIAVIDPTSCAFLRFLK